MGFLRKLFISKQSSIGSAAFILMATVGGSRILGLIRDRLLAHYFAPEELGVYFAAFRLPNMMFELLITGSLTTAFIPVFTKLLTKHSEESAWKMASVVMNIGSLLLIGITIPIVLFAEPLSKLLAPGFSTEEIQLMAQYTRLMIIFQVYPLMIGNFLSGILQSYQMFIVPALAPVLYNLGIIIGVILLAPVFGLMAPVVGVIFGAILFFAIHLLPLIVIKYTHRWSINPKVSGVKEVGALMLPRTVGVGVGQIDTTVDLILASFLGSKMITLFQFAQHLQNLPVGLFGATIAQAALPMLSRASAGDEKANFRKQLISAIHQILFFVLPVSVFFVVLRIPITRLAFGTDNFDWEATVLTGKTLSAFGISLFAQAIVHVLARGFYALYDTKTPVIIGIISIVINAVLSVLFVTYLHLPVWSLGLSTSIASIFQALALFLFLQRKIGRFTFNEVVLLPVRMILSAGLMGILLFVLVRLLDQLIFDTTRTINLIFLTGIVGIVGLTVYVFLSWVLGVGQVNAFISLLKRIDKIRSKFLPSSYPLLPDQEQKEL